MKKIVLETICEIVAGQSPPSSTYNTNGDGLPFYQGKADFGDVSPKTRIWCNAPKKIAEKDDILLSVRAPVGPTNLCVERSCIGRGLSAIRCRDNVSVRYIRQYMKSIEDRWDSSERGSTFSSITQDDIKALHIPIPYPDDSVKSLAEQQRIAGILDKADLVRKKRAETLDLIDEFLKSTFLDMFGDPVTNPKGWKPIQLMKLTKKIGSGATPRGGKESYQDEGISLIRSMNVHDANFRYKALAHIDEHQAHKLRNVIVESDDVLLNITGASVCRCAMVPDDVLPARVNQHVAIIRPDRNVLSSYFLQFLLISPNYKKFLLKLATSGGATREALTKDQVEQLEIITPSISLQNKFSEIVRKQQTIVANMQKEKIESENLFNVLVQRAFKGGL